MYVLCVYIFGGTGVIFLRDLLKVVFILFFVYGLGSFDQNCISISQIKL
jgi:hypothetical protein